VVPKARSGRRKVTVKGCLAVVAGTALVANVLHGMYDGVQTGVIPGWMLWTAVGVVGAGAGVQLATQFGPLVRMVTNIKFGVALFMVLIVATITGTIVLQGAEAGVFEERYGSAAGVLRWLHVPDIFHSFWFTWLLGLAGLSQLGLIIKRKAWRWREIGFLFAHGGTIALLLGGAIGSMYGVRGNMNLLVGQSTGQFRHQQNQGPVAMPFEIKLDGFDIDRRDPEYRLYVLREEEKGSWNPEASHPADAPAVHALDSTWRVEIVKFEPHPDPEQKIVADDDGHANPAIEVQIGRSNGWLFANHPARSTFKLPQGDLIVRFAWTEPKLVAGQAARHLLGAAGSVAPVEVTVGQELRLGGAHWKVTGWMPDFRWDIKTRKAITASQEPKNPALSIQRLGMDGKPTGQPQWLFASGRSMGHEVTSAKLAYSYVAGSAKGRVVTFVGGAGQAIVSRDGKVIQRHAVQIGTPLVVAGVPLTVHQVLADARIDNVAPDPDSPPVNPALTLKITGPQGSKQIVLREEGRSGIRLDDDRAIRFSKKSDDIVNFNSTLSVVVDGEVKHTQQVSVNNPLTWEGYKFYQNSYDPKNPRYAGIMVVKDPGLSLVYLGLWGMMIGVAHILFMRRRRKRAVAGATIDKTQEVT